jgi:hypothetical protein
LLGVDSNDLLLRAAAATAFDELQVGVHFIGSVDGHVDHRMPGLTPRHMQVVP